jgi:hypothetical protein
MNHADFCVTPSDRPSSCDEMLFVAVGDEPDGGKPFIETEGGILEDRSDLERELLAASLALPDLAGGNERWFAVVATRADDFAARPAELENEIEGPVEIAEIADSLNQVGGFGNRFHTRMLRRGCDKYHSCSSPRQVRQVSQCPKLRSSGCRRHE